MHERSVGASQTCPPNLARVSEFASRKYGTDGKDAFSIGPFRIISRMGKLGKSRAGKSTKMSPGGGEGSEQDILQR